MASDARGRGDRRGLLAKHHHHLERAKIVVLGKPKPGRRGSKVNVAKASKAAAALNTLVNDEIGEVHYQIAIGRDAWDKLDAKQRPDCARPDTAPADPSRRARLARWR